jgi:16S rRNA G966 N2-methylase RsmD
MCGLVEANLDLCGVPEEMTEVVCSDAAEYLRRTSAANWRGGSEAWNIVFFDPPYALNYLPVLEAFGQQTDALLTESGILVIEHHHKNPLRDELGHIRRWRILRQGDSALSFYERA